MPPPRICPQPPDCGLFDQRLHDQDEVLRRAVLRERHKPNALASLVWADFNRHYQRAEVPARPTRPDLPPPPEPVVLPGVPKSQKGARQ